MSGFITPFYLLAVKSYFGNLAPVFLLCIMLGIGYSVAFLYSKGVRVPFFSQLIDMAERENSRATPGKGTFRFFTGVLLAYIVVLLMNKPYYLFASSILVLALGDSASTLAGVKIGRRKIPYNRDKSIEGALAGFSIAFIGIFLTMGLFFGVSPGDAALISITASFTGMLIESLPLPIDDNLTIPVSSILVLSFLF